MSQVFSGKNINEKFFILEFINKLIRNYLPKIFDAYDFTVLCQVNVGDLGTGNVDGGKSDEFDPAHTVFINGFFIDIENVVVTSSDGHAYLFALPEM